MRSEREREKEQATMINCAQFKKPVNWHQNRRTHRLTDYPVKNEKGENKAQEKKTNEGEKHFHPRFSRIPIKLTKQKKGTLEYEL